MAKKIFTDKSLSTFVDEIKAYTDGEVSSKVDKVTGKGLSTNDYTTAEKNKLSGIATGAQVNQNAFSNVAVSGQTTVAADTTTDTLTLAGSNVTITTDATNDKITFSVADGSTSGKGVVQLTNSTSSTSTTTAATPSSVKSAYDLANQAKTAAATAQTTADGKANASHTHTISDVTNLQSTLDGKANVDKCITSLSVSGQTITYTKGDGSTGTIKTQDTDTKVSQIHSTTDYDFPILATVNNTASDTVGDTRFNSSMTLNPYTKTISANIQGRAALAHYARALPSENLKDKFFKISMKPAPWMMAFTIRAYGGYSYTDLTVSGYNYGSAHWYLPKVTLSGNIDVLKVDFGYDENPDTSSNYDILWVAFPATGRAYTGIDIIDAVIGNGNQDLRDMFTIELVSELTGTIQSTQYPQRPLRRDETISVDKVTGVLPIDKGGTGATTAAAALTNLGVTATATELNYVDGVTSNIQTQLDGKASSSHAHNEYMTKSDPVGTGSFSMNRLTNSFVGAYSHAEGLSTAAYGMASHAEGIDTTAGDYSHAEGRNTTASGDCSHAEGSCTTASGACSHAEGDNTAACGLASHAEGSYTTALDYQHAQGHYNNTTNAKEGIASGSGDGTAFVIGNGTSSSKSNAFRVSYAGKPYGKSSFTTAGCDYAEFFEWKDLNPNDEDRRGYFVTLDEDKIKIAEPNDYILGIISGQPSVVGNGDEDWLGRYVFDEFGAYVYEDFEYEVDEFDKETGEKITVTKTGKKYKENPDYDPTIPYIQREDRPEWDYVGMLGVLSVRDDGTCKVNGYCTVAEGGIATASETGYRVIKRVNENIVKVIFR